MYVTYISLNLHQTLKTRLILVWQYQFILVYFMQGMQFILAYLNMVVRFGFYFCLKTFCIAFFKKKYIFILIIMFVIVLRLRFNIFVSNLFLLQPFILFFLLVDFRVYIDIYMVPHNCTPTQPKLHESWHVYTVK